MKPYLSVVVAARNDNHGGNMLGRMRAMMDSFIVQAEQYGLPSEIIVVEWNPPSGAVRLKEALNWGPRPKHCDIRFIEVPEQQHALFGNSVRIPLHQMIAKNVGIRRAQGEFVLATNIDIIFSAELMQFLANRRLNHGVLYRIDRYDVRNDLPRYESVGDLVTFCKRNTLRVFAREGEFRLLPEGHRKLETPDIVAESAGIHFGEGWSWVESLDGQHHRWVESEAELFFTKPTGAASELWITVEPGPSAGQLPVTVDFLDSAGFLIATTSITRRCELQLRIPSGVVSGKLLLRIRGADLPLSRNPRIINLRVLSLSWAPDPEPRTTPDWQLAIANDRPGFDWAASFDAPSRLAKDIRQARYLHTNASGDFTLLAREDWFSLRAYPEFPIWPMHLDSLFCYTAFHAGMSEFILRDPLRIYHIEHASAAGWAAEGEQQRAQRIAARGITELSYGAVAKWVDLMRRYDAPVVFATDSWGLAQHDLCETS